MIKKCDFPDCDKAGVCRAPKSRELSEYFYFCREHAAEYNKNWNYYANMTTAEINEDWERSVFGYTAKDTKTAKIETDEYLEFMNKFINGRGTGSVPPKKEPTITASVTVALKTLMLPPTASWTDVQTQYRKLAKEYHPDIAQNIDDKIAAEKFSNVSSAYSVLTKHFRK